ncbi:Rieske (2Fe-2S) protein [Nocardioides daeguensis]|uniref:Rieske domain-containing protein n=1 Tax=Nocardioides daeguensis TaxID=908359 RepID=A0ABP6VXX5_9ACTN|nr:Rieske (2Fe-2S) protein [Nocardioides daeguensis]MBV6726730.1 Rieske (2Fe-2S) protein [Nocardioides daeguensis]MCR1774518.1 Rieske (2Fe-2S) protein [Nocardioides daeguensis]
MSIGEVRASRRIVFSGLGALGVAAALAGCAGSNGGSTKTKVSAGTELATTAEVPVGGGIILADQKLVITQPTAGTYDAFSAVCTHQGLLVTSVEDGTIRCANHGSAYSATTGEVEGGPAPSALAKVEIKVDGDKILAA